MKTVRVRLNRAMHPIDGQKRLAGYETNLPVAVAEQWAKNGRISIIATGKESARPKAGAADPTLAPPSGSPAGLGAVSSSSLPAPVPAKKTSKPRGRPAKAKPPTVDPFG